MRRSRRSGGSAAEFGSSGEDSFVAVVVTKLTGALLFILLLTMVIMALLPKAVDLGQPGQAQADATAASEAAPLQITTPATLPDAIAGRPYLVALAATGGRGAPRWSVLAALPGWLHLDEASGQLSGTPVEEKGEPLVLAFQVSDGASTASQSSRLVVLPPQASAGPRSWWQRRLSGVPWRSWLEQGVGFLLIWLVHLLGMNLLAQMERYSLDRSLLTQGSESVQLGFQSRFTTYRLVVRVASAAATIALGIWLVIASRGAV
ncbi:MAG: Ig domain-containing protein [Isosphaeraceae bacterium]